MLTQPTLEQLTGMRLGASESQRLRGAACEDTGALVSPSANAAGRPIAPPPIYVSSKPAVAAPPSAVPSQTLRQAPSGGSTSDRGARP